MSSNTPKIADLARMLNLSKPAVAQALSENKGNTNTRISNATRQRVIEAAAAMNYRVNASARAMRQKKFNNIGFFVVRKDPNDYTFADIISQGIATAAEKHEQNVFLVRLPETGSLTSAIPKSLREACLDGLLIQEGASLTADFQRAIDSADFPVVYLNEKRPTNAIYVDDIYAGRLMTEHLIEKGYRKITMLSPSLTINHYSSADRAQGYREAMQAAGLHPVLKMFPSATWKVETAAWLQSGDRPEVVLCVSDQVAVHLQGILYRLKIRIPEEIGITGYNDELFAQYSQVPLTTMKVPFYEMALSAVDMLMTLIKNPGTRFVESLIVRPALSIRTSVPGPSC